MPSTTSAPLTKAAYITRANALCRAMNARIAALGNPGSDPMKEAQTTDETAAITGSTLRELRTLRPPTGDTAALTAIYAKVDKLLADSASLSAALRARDRAAAQRALTDVQTDSDDANAASNAYGLTVCGS